MPSEVGQEFGEPSGYPYMVVCSPSCHDTSTTRAWFEEDDGRRERFCSDALSIQVRGICVQQPDKLTAVSRCK
jgi:4-alpha-glucanotransferase